MNKKKHSPRHGGTNKKPNKKVTGIISITARGVGYVATDVSKDDIEIPSEQLNTALHGDSVEIHLHPPRSKYRLQGKVVAIQKRSKTSFVGILKKDKDTWYLTPDDRRMYTDIKITKLPNETSWNTLQENTKALVVMHEWINPKQAPTGTIKTILGPAGTHDVEMRAIVLGHNFDTSFPDAVEKEAKEIQKETQNESHISTTNGKQEHENSISSRRDMRGVPTFTIDPADAKDFDDAISIQTLPNNDIEVGVHIADVSHYVTEGSAMDEEAQSRATSIYLVDRTIPMLPEALSNDVCSLNEKEDKLTFSAIFTLTHDGVVKSSWFGKTVIHSQKRFTYEDAQKIIDAEVGLFANELAKLNDIAKIIRKRRIAKGALTFEQDEIAFELDRNGAPTRIYKKEHLATHRLVEEYMLLANRLVAEYVETLAHKNNTNKNDDPIFIYRIHDVPNREKLEELQTLLKAVGYPFNIKGEISGKDINAMLKKIKGTPIESLVTQAAIRTMSKAIYTTKNIGHFGLAFEHYTHFTSPIRRYPDIMVHRLLEKHLSSTPISQNELAKYEKLASSSTEREIEAAQAERDSIKYKQVEFMQNHVGKMFKGTITGVVEWGLYVAENDTGAEGLITISSLKNDYFVFDKKHFALVGKKSKKRYRLGDTVTVRLTSANLEQKTLDWTIV